MRSLVRDAFAAASRGYSADRIVADPELNRDFIDACRQAGLSDPIRDLNLAILNLRKSGDLGPQPNVQRTRFPDLEEYRHASEIAARHMDVKYGLSWDEILATPELIAEFDAEAAAIAPGFEPLKYRWAVFNLRKQRRLRPELLTRVLPPTAVTLGPLESVDLSKIPAEQGLYLFYSASGALYVGEATNLRKRIAKHLDHSDSKGLARWLWEHGVVGAHLEVRTLPKATATRIRRALEVELIQSRQPLFNIKLS